MNYEIQDQIPDNVYGLLRQVLPVALTRGIVSYTEFSEKSAPENAKDFIAYHTACKAALGHLGALLKIGDACNKAAPPVQQKPLELEDLLRQTRQVMSQSHAP